MIVRQLNKITAAMIGLHSSLTKLKKSIFDSNVGKLVLLVHQIKSAVKIQKLTSTAILLHIRKSDRILGICYDRSQPSVFLRVIYTTGCVSQTDRVGKIYIFLSVRR